MLDIKFVAANEQLVADNIVRRHASGNAQACVALYKKRNEGLTELETTRAEGNASAKAMQGKMEPDERQRRIEHGRALKQRISDLEKEVAQLDADLQLALRQLPNMTHPDVPGGKTDDDHVVLKTVGKPKPMDFAPLDHVQLAEKLELIDFDAGAKVAGQKFYFLKNQMVLLDLALQRFAIDRLVEIGRAHV